MVSSKLPNNRRALNSGMNSTTIDSTNKVSIANNNNDETWKKLEDLINIGRTDQRVSLQTPHMQESS